MSTTTAPSDPVAALKLAHRATWAAGDYAAVARHIADRPVRDALAAARVQTGTRLLDVATGSGNTDSVLGTPSCGICAGCPFK